ncbi:Imm32 family immunity protein [Acidovorax sp. LjRoot117]|uniref:Imm32 family immunity protein n=1 Tax=Acidovorax sp. LjRoot117 TaxID=3342255 RepID=UPI003ECE599E
MKIFGHTDQEVEPKYVVSGELAEITLCATPGELRRMSEFLVFCAAEMDRMGDDYGHIHLGDRMKEFDGSSPHFVVFRAEVS